MDDYAELLGVYLGDGCISELERTFRLRIALDLKYPEIIRDCRALMERTFPKNPVGLVKFKQGNYINLSVYHRHLPCLFPQHARGKKHERRITLEDWQFATVVASPWRFIRGCIRTDGCVFVNRTGPYEYLSYHFANMSRDIAEYLAFALGSVGVSYRLTSGSKTGLNVIRVNRRASVAAMVENVGVKR